MSEPEESESEILVPDSEEVVRAVLKSDYDLELGMVSSESWTGRNQSVSQLSKLSLDEIIEIYRFFPGRPYAVPPNPLVGTVTLAVGRLKQIATDFNPQVALRVVEDPIPQNRAHAEIRDKITQGLAKKLARNTQCVLI